MNTSTNTGSILTVTSTTMGTAPTRMRTCMKPSFRTHEHLPGLTALRTTDLTLTIGTPTASPSCGYG